MVSPFMSSVPNNKWEELVKRFSVKSRSEKLVSLLPYLFKSESSLPLLAGILMVGASAIGWVIEPLYGTISAWNIPIDIGWSIRSPFINYGLLCVFCACYQFLVSFASWRKFPGSGYFERRQNIVAGIVCILPVLLFLDQYLFVEQGTVALFAQQRLQYQLIQGHFNYSLGPQLLKIVPFTLDISTINGRTVLLIDQLWMGAILPLISAFLLFGHKWRYQEVSTTKKFQILWHFYVVVGIFLLVLLGRAPLASLYIVEAQQNLNVGEYSQALDNLNTADALNPYLDQIAYYHTERGQALYFLHPGQQDAESNVYLASVYSKEARYTETYQILHMLWLAQPQSPWVVDAINTTLEHMAENTPSLNGASTIKPTSAEDAKALALVLQLSQVDPSNVYGQYVLGILNFRLHNYSECIAQMRIVVQESSDMDIQSAAYTAIGLSEAGLGDTNSERAYLLQAELLDPNYRNGTAREELSGLH